MTMTVALPVIMVCLVMATYVRHDVGAADGESTMPGGAA